MDNNRLLRHQLATLAYRTRKTLDGATPDFGAFDAGAGVRTPHQVVNHMTNLMAFTARTIRGEEGSRLEQAADFPQEVARFYALLAELSTVLSAVAFEGSETAERLLQGPLSDAMTHVGQLALLRRLAGQPVAGENFFAAEISVDDLEGLQA